LNMNDVHVSFRFTKTIPITPHHTLHYNPFERRRIRHFSCLQRVHHLRVCALREPRGAAMEGG
jgi:hypothetical protein